VAVFPDLPVSQDPLNWPGYPAKLAQARQRTGQNQAVNAGPASVNGQACIALIFNFEFLAGTLGQAEGEAVQRAAAEAAARRIPLVSVVRSGGARMQEGTTSLFQMAAIARALTELAASGTPHIAVVGNPATGGVWASLSAAADVLIAVRDAQVAFAGARVRADRSGPAEPAFAAAGKHASGFIDAVVAEDELPLVVGRYVELLSPANRAAAAPPPLPAALSGPPPRRGWAAVAAARSPQRAAAAHYLAEYFDQTVTIWGDRVGGVDPQLACGIGRRGSASIAYVCQQGGPVAAAGFRTATRLLALAQRLGLPVITFVDTEGAQNTAEAETAGVGTAIAQLLQQVASTEVPMLSVIVGQGVSGGAMSLLNPHNVWLAPDSYLAVITPESAAAILKRPDAEVPELAGQLGLAPEDLVRLGLARGVLQLAQIKGSEQ
jgi:acetyl-CoA carboxylase carboxyl transferase subunit beta